MAIPKKRLERIKQLEAKADAKYKRIKKRYGYEFSIDKRIASEMSAKQAREYEKYLEEYTSRQPGGIGDAVHGDIVVWCTF